MAAMETAIENARKAIEKDWIRQPVNKFFDIKSIEVSVDHRTVVVVWADGETTQVVRSANDPDDIYGSSGKEAVRVKQRDKEDYQQEDESTRA